MTSCDLRLNYELVHVFRVSKDFSPHLVCLSVWSTVNTSLLTDWLLGSDESVGRASLTRSCPIDHVVSRWTGDAGRASLGRAQGTVSTLWGDTSDHIGDVDGIDLCHVSTVFPLLREDKDLISHQLRHSTQRTVVGSASRNSLYRIFSLGSHCRHLINYCVSVQFKGAWVSSCYFL